MVEGLKPWEFSPNTIAFEATVSYTASLLLEESATEMLLPEQSNPEPGGWDAVWGPTALKFSLPRAAPSAGCRVPGCSTGLSPAQR